MQRHFNSGDCTGRLHPSWRQPLFAQRPTHRSVLASLRAQLELVADDLPDFITDAHDITVYFTDVLFHLEKFYTVLDFPEYLAEHAASDARSNAADPFEIDMWTLHSEATYALTHFFRGKEGAALDGYVRTANDILFNPDGTLDRVEAEYKQQAES